MSWLRKDAMGVDARKASRYLPSIVQRYGHRGTNSQRASAGSSRPDTATAHCQEQKRAQATPARIEDNVTKVDCIAVRH